MGEAGIQWVSMTAAEVKLDQLFQRSLIERSERLIWQCDHGSTKNRIARIFSYHNQGEMQYRRKEKRLQVCDGKELQLPYRGIEMHKHINGIWQK